MIHEITEARPQEGHRIWLRFDDGAEGVVDLAALVPFVGIFEPLRDQARFEDMRLDPELGTICWPNGADLDPLVLYARITGSSLPGARYGEVAE